MDWKWNLKGLKKVNKNGLKVFSCFSCGGGSTMGYKLAGYDVVGNCEIDPKMNDMYIRNHHPRYNYQMDIRKFKTLDDLPEELYNLDILDGSPPCSTFSLAGSREKAWGKEKVFREGQAAQTLDDLFFEFLDVAERLKPKVIIAENVKGLIMGNAKGYLNEILKRLEGMGYDAQIFMLNAAFMGVPQRRERVFVIAHQKQLPYKKLGLQFTEQPIKYGTIKSGKGKPINPNSKTYYLWTQRKQGDRHLGDINNRLIGKKSCFNTQFFYDEWTPKTLTSNGMFIRYDEPYFISDMDMVHMQTFPEDYNFCSQNVQYVCGMSVPPVMMAKIAEQIKLQWFK
jgi:DNA (cytosine-5)-methyltransferase 1